MLTDKLRALVFPEGLLLLAVAALVHWGAATPSTAPLVRLYPAVVLGVGALLAWRFRRGRILLALLGLVLADRAMLWLVPIDSGAAHADPVIVRAVAIVLPAAFAGLAFMRERDLLSPVGARRLLVLVAQAAALVAVWVLSAVDPEATAHVLDLSIVPGGLLAWFPLGQPAALVALAAIVALVGRTLWRPEAESRAFLWAAVGCVIAASVGPSGGRATLHLANAGLVLVLATVQGAYAMAYHDELTGLPARRALNEALGRAGQTYTVALVDVDHFKKFNDSHGHDVGDQVLRMVASRLARVGGGGRAYRYGGEEFAIVFPDLSVDESLAHLDVLRESVADASFTLRGPGRPKQKPKGPARGSRGARTKQLSVTVSIGAAQASGPASPDAVVKAADRALYRAKDAGRNRVETGKGR